MKLLSLLGAREPAKKGVNLDDMGVWSLLWVNQDEFATTEPSARLGDHTRETLALSIGGIVGDVMGGEHGTTLRRAIEDSYSELWTPKQTERATGKLPRREREPPRPPSKPRCASSSRRSERRRRSAASSISSRSSEISSWLRR